MTTTQLFDEWDTAFAELCAGYDKPCTNERRAAYRKSFGKMHPAAWQSLVDHCLSPKGPEKFPTTHGLWHICRELRKAQRAPGPQQSETESFSRWAMLANRALLQLAYLDERRGFRPIAEYPPESSGSLPMPIDRALLDKALAAKADYVRMAEEAETFGRAWDTKEFRDLVYDGLEKILGTSSARA